MKIVVCIKQVPNVSQMKFDPVKKTIIREGVLNEVSSFDIRALLRAIDLVKEQGGEVVALTMGPPQAVQALQHCLALGAHRGIHLTDKAFAGADTLATARALALAIKREAADLIFCGRYSVDAETGQVGPELAELLSLPQVTGARKITVAGRTATVERETDEGFETVEVPLPFVLTAAEDLSPERFPMKKDREAAKTKPIQTVTAADLSGDASVFGIAGSPTSVREIQILEAKRKCEFVTVEELVPRLLDRGLFGKMKTTMTAVRPATRKSDHEIWVVAETLGGTVRRVTYELLGRAADLGHASAVLLGREVRIHVLKLAAHGAERVYLADSPALDPFATEPHAAVLTRAIQERKPHSVLIPSTAMGRDLAPRVAARLGLGLTGDAIGLEMEGDQLIQLKPAFGGNVVAPIISKTYPQMATVRPGVLRAHPPDMKLRAEVIELKTDDLAPSRVKILSRQAVSAGEAADLDTAEVVVGFGMGIGAPENIAKVRELAAVLKAPLATTRDCTDKGWLPKQHQIGLTGKYISPRLYFAIGIRGAFEHTVGIQKAKTIVAINSDDQAWIWDSADFGLKGDWNEIVPCLTQAVAAAKTASA